MPGRRYAKSTVQVERASLANSGATLQKTVSYAAVTGLTAIEAAVIHLSSSKVPTDLGIAGGDAYLVNVETERMLAGTDLRRGDRVKITATGETFTLVEAKLVEGRYWACMAERKQG